MSNPVSSMEKQPPIHHKTSTEPWQNVNGWTSCSQNWSRTNINTYQNMDKHGVSEEFQVFFWSISNKSTRLRHWSLGTLKPSSTSVKTPDFKATPGAMARAPERLELDPEQPKFLLLAPQPQAQADVPWNPMVPVEIAWNTSWNIPYPIWMVPKMSKSPGPHGFWRILHMNGRMNEL